MDQLIILCFPIREYCKHPICNPQSNSEGSKINILPPTAEHMLIHQKNWIMYQTEQFSTSSSNLLQHMSLDSQSQSTNHCNKPTRSSRCLRRRVQADHFLMKILRELRGSATKLKVAKMGDNSFRLRKLRMIISNSQWSNSNLLYISLKTVPYLPRTGTCYQPREEPRIRRQLKPWGSTKESGEAQVHIERRMKDRHFSLQPTNYLCNEWVDNTSKAETRSKELT